MNFEELLRVMKEKKINKTKLQELLGLSKKAIWKRFKGMVEFRRDEIVKLKRILSLSDEQLLAIFFNG